MLPISVIILAKNKYKETDKFVSNLKEFSEIIVIVDGKGIDETKGKLQTFYKDLNEDFAAQRNYALKKAKNKWILFLDSDEELSQNLKFEIKNVSDGSVNGYFIKREDNFLGHFMKHGDTGNFWILRLAKKDKGSWRGRVHETWDINGNISHLKNPIIHHSHENLSSFIKKLDFYSSIRAKEIHEEGIKSSPLFIVIFPILKFCNLYFWKLGFLDRNAGFVHAGLMSLYTFLVRAKLYFYK